MTTLRPFQEHTFKSFDTTLLFYRYWPAVSGNDEAKLQDQSQKKAIVLFHRGHEHGGRMAHVVDEINLPDCSFFAWDARGLGRSPGERGYAENFGVLVKDIDTFIQYISTQYDISIENIAVIAQSVGAVVAATWVHDYAPKICCMVLASPAFKVKLYVPFARAGLAILHKLMGKFFVNSYVKAQYLTHDKKRIDSYNTDPLITRPIAVNILLGLYDAAERVINDAGAIRVPTQLLISGADWVVHQAPQHTFLERLGSLVKEAHVLDGFFHDTLGEKDRHKAIDKARNFILRCFTELPTQRNLLAADREGYTYEEFVRLSAPPQSAAARLYWALSRFWIGVGAHLSKGLKISVDTGFDSGSTLDYVYRNTPQGFTVVGCAIDKMYLNSIGWRGIRIRKMHLERIIGTAVDLLKSEGKPIRIVDIAAGHGRYILDALTNRKKEVDHILLRDYSPINVDAGRNLIKEKGMENVAEFQEGNAFDRHSLAALTPKPTLAVVSGLYELFPDNTQISTSLAGLSDALEKGAYLIYTNQPWHPQLELIARSLTSHRQGQAWVMRRRTQAEMDQLVENAGFEKLDQHIDAFGIFTVSIARKK
ncbi:MAG: bifunctional alpha/beta hydrolase/class I SAM-dependent methyltransferase [Pseudomonadota bacterium]